MRDTMSDQEVTSYPVRAEVPKEVVDVLDRLRKGEQDETVDSTVTNEYLRRLNSAGWPTRALANAFGHVYHQAIYARIKTARKYDPAEVEQDVKDLPIPTPPPRERKPKPATPETPEKYRVPDEVVRRIRRIAPLARKNSANSDPEGPAAQAADELTAIFLQEHQNGASFAEIARASKYTVSAVRLRLGRAGYMPLPPSQENTLHLDLREAEESDETSDE